MVEMLLTYYREIKDTEIYSDLAEYKLDLDRALLILEPDELELLDALYFIEPISPERTGKVGRPKGGSTQGKVANEMATTTYSDTARQAEITRRKQAIFVKIAEYLGPGYE